MKKILLVLGLLITHDAMAQSCIAVPDCAAMGYTETSCEGDFLRCPFDTTKMACVVKKTTGASTGCEVGMIYYSDGTCSSLYNATKSIAGIVVEKDRLIMSRPIYMAWGNYGTDVSGLTNMTSSTAKTDMNGKSNTSIIASAHSSAGITSNVSAAMYCNSYTGGIEGTAGDWYLPAAGELYTYWYGYYMTLSVVAESMGWVYFSNNFFSSSEANENAAFVVYPNGSMGYGLKSSTSDYVVSCFLAL